MGMGVKNKNGVVDCESLITTIFEYIIWNNLPPKPSRHSL